MKHAAQLLTQLNLYKKGNQYCFDMKAHIGTDNESGLVHTVVGTATNAADVTQIDKLLSGAETWLVTARLTNQYRIDAR